MSPFLTPNGLRASLNTFPWATLPVQAPQEGSSFRSRGRPERHPQGARAWDGWLLYDFPPASTCSPPSHPHARPTTCLVARWFYFLPARAPPQLQPTSSTPCPRQRPRPSDSYLPQRTRSWRSADASSGRKAHAMEDDSPHANPTSPASMPGTVELVALASASRWSAGRPGSAVF